MTIFSFECTNCQSARVGEGGVPLRSLPIDSWRLDSGLSLGHCRQSSAELSAVWIVKCGIG